MPSKFWIIAVVILAIIVAVATAAVQAIVVGEGFAIDGTTRALLLGELAAVGSVAGILEAYNRRLWRIWPFNLIRWSDKPPVLRGTWLMKLVVVRPAPHQTAGSTKKGRLVLDQTVSRVQVTTYFADGDSRSTQAILERVNDIWTLNFFYQFFLDNGESYWGAARLSVTANGLSGTYWNARGGEGSWKSTARTHDVHRSREAAEKAL
jgi:hypothetical protein